MAKSQPNYLAPNTGRQSHPNRQPTDYGTQGTSVATPSTPSTPDFGGNTFVPMGGLGPRVGTPAQPAYQAPNPVPQPLGQTVDQAAVMRQHLLNRQTTPPIDPNAYATAGGYRVAQNVALHQQRHPNAAIQMLQQPTVPGQQPGIPTTNVPVPGTPIAGGGIVPGQPTTNVPGNVIPPAVLYGGGTGPGMYQGGLPRGFTGTPYGVLTRQTILNNANPTPDTTGNYGGSQYNLPPGWSYDQSGNIRQNGYDGTVRDANGQPQYNPGANGQSFQTQTGNPPPQNTQFNYPGYDREAMDREALAKARQLFMLGGGGLAPNALESQDPTQLGLLQSAARKWGVDWNSFMRQYAASRMQQGGAQQA